MSKDQLAEYISQGREIEFSYNGKKYSITYGTVDGKAVISFCEFYKETTEVEDIEELVKVERDGITVLNMLESLNDEDIYIFQVIEMNNSLAEYCKKNGMENLIAEWDYEANSPLTVQAGK